ncbi:MAG: hypothetical protein K9J30_01965 [Bacteroidales bacterium]|nr:hypothetical protein [Bacteroidales bacterium]
MEIKKFRNHYGLELITASHAGIQTGDLVWDRLVSAPDFAHDNMPNTIQTAFLDAGLIDRQEFLDFEKEYEETPLIAAHLADTKIDVNTELLTELKHPTLGTIEGNFQLDTISKFRFGNLQAREMSDLLRVKIDHYLEIMRRNKWEEYDGRIRRVNMITELYYGSIKLVVERSLSGKMDAAIKQSAIDLIARAEGSRSVEYEFSHENVPFAMRIEKVRTFNG